MVFLKRIGQKFISREQETLIPSNKNYIYPFSKAVVIITINSDSVELKVTLRETDMVLKSPMDFSR